MTGSPLPALFLTTAIALVAAAPAAAQEAPAAATTATAQTGTAEAAPAPGEVVVTATRRRTDDVLGEVKLLSGEALATAARPTLGETLATVPGVSVGGSGPNVGKPVVRGLSGNRVRILSDGLSSLDVAASSSDHAVAIDPLNADSIEVVHGPASLVYGPSAVGGVVDVIDSRIPRRKPDGVAASGRAALSSAVRGGEVGGRVDVTLGGNWVGHLDASAEEHGDMAIGGPVLAAPLRAEARASADPEIRALADLAGRLPNSDSSRREGAVAIAHLGDRLDAGVSLTRREGFYGVPIRYSLDPAEEAEAVHIDLAQTRLDARAGLKLEGFLREVRLRAAASDYDHAETEEDGSVGSRVIARGGEARLDLIQRDIGRWGGRSGLQLFDARQRIEGDEQYLPPSRQRDWAAFTIQHVGHGPVRLEAGARIQRSIATARANAATFNPDLARRFTGLSLSGGASLDVTRALRLTLDANRSQRPPSVEELFANGPHAGNAIFEIGDPGLSMERNVGIEIGIHKHRGRLTFDLSAYRNRFANFIYQSPTLAVIDGLPVHVARQGRATYQGVEGQVDVALGMAMGARWRLGLRGDTVRATIDGVGPAPLVPPLRLGGDIEASRGPLTARVEVEHNAAHRRTAAIETPTDGFTLVSAGVEWALPGRAGWSLALEGENLGNVNGRRSTSLLKDHAPIAGRDIRLTLRVAAR